MSDAFSLVVATRSDHKVREIREILAGEGLGPSGIRRSVNVLSLFEAGVDVHPEEDGLEPFDTFEENAASKARYFCEKTGLATVADDSGLEVTALGGAPGVRTKRFASLDLYPGLDQTAANNAHLLESLTKNDAERQAQFVCVAVLEFPDGRRWTFRGEASGVIGMRPSGEGGFGYDPVFVDPVLGLSFAQISAEQKNARSHRGRAFRALAAFIAKEDLA